MSLDYAPTQKATERSVNQYLRLSCAKSGCIKGLVTTDRGKNLLKFESD